MNKGYTTPGFLLYVQDYANRSHTSDINVTTFMSQLQENHMHTVKISSN